MNVLVFYPPASDLMGSDTERRDNFANGHGMHPKVVQVILWGWTW